MNTPTYMDDIRHEGTGTRGLVYWCWIVNDPVFLQWTDHQGVTLPTCPRCHVIDEEAWIDRDAEGQRRAWQLSDGFMGTHDFRCAVGKRTVALRRSDVREVTTVLAPVPIEEVTSHG